MKRFIVRFLMVKYGSGKSAKVPLLVLLVVIILSVLFDYLGIEDEGFIDYLVSLLDFM